MSHEPTSTIRARRLRARRSQGVVMVAPVEVGEVGIDLLVSNGLLDQDKKNNRQEVGKACLAALEQWASGQYSSEGALQRCERHTNVFIATPDLRGRG